MHPPQAIVCTFENGSPRNTYRITRAAIGNGRICRIETASDRLMYTRLRHTAIRSMELLIPRIQKMVDGESSIVLRRAGERLRRMIRQVKNCFGCQQR